MDNSQLTLHETDFLRRESSVYNRIIQQIRTGASVIFPTETIYGLGAIATNADAVKRLFAIKGRSPLKPPPIIVSNNTQLSQLVSYIPDNAAALMERYWPGALTIIFPARDILPDIICGESTFEGKKIRTIAVRMTSGRLAKALCEAVNAPLVATSANFSGATGNAATPKVLSDIPSEFQHQVDAIIDGIAEADKPSTIVDCTVYPSRVLREGAIVI